MRSWEAMHCAGLAASLYEFERRRALTFLPVFIETCQHRSCYGKLRKQYLQL
jgi:hypothetical protein